MKLLGNIDSNQDLVTREYVLSHAGEGGTGGGGIGSVLTAWEDYDSSKAEYALGAALGYELHQQLLGIDGLIDEINGEII